MEWTGELLRLSLSSELDGALHPAPPCEPRHSLHYASAFDVLPLDRTSRHSVHSVDESGLLAEAEELLASLDTAAFATRTPNTVDSATKSSWTAAGSPVTVRESARPLTAAPRTKRRKVSPQSSPNAESDTSTSITTAAEKKSALSWRDRVREEIMQLRSVATKLEVQLLLLEQQSHSTAVVRNTRVQIWKRLAERQVRLRELALAENAQLKAMMAAMLRTGGCMNMNNSNQQQDAALTMAQLPNYLLGPHKEAIVPPRDVVMATVFEPLLARLDTCYSEVDAVFRENGMSRSSVEPNSYMQRKTRRLGQSCRYIELGDKRTLPFAWRTVGHISWQCNRAWHHKDQPYVYPCTDRPSDTFAVNYRVTHRAFSANESVDFKLVVRRYVERDRLVVVYACQSDGEKALAGVTVRKVGWIVTRDAQLASQSPDDDNTQPITTVQSCMHVFLDNDDPSSDLGVSTERVNRVVNLMLCAFEEDVVHLSQNVDNRLLEGARMQSTRIPAVEAFAQQQHIAPPMPRVQVDEHTGLPLSFR